MSIHARQTSNIDWSSNDSASVFSDRDQQEALNRADNYDPTSLSWRLQSVRRSFSVRRAEFDAESIHLETKASPCPGDLVLAQVTSIGHHARLELTNGRRSHLYPGDEILVAFGHRYAADQFEAEIPETLEHCHLVAAGGIASKMISRHARVKEPTKILPLGLLARADGKVLNLNQWRLNGGPIASPLPPIIIVAGTSMNAGKTTAAASLVKGLRRAGKRIGAAKVTGTGAGGDYWQMTDAGAEAVVDFTDAGHASTYHLAPRDVEQVFLRLIGHLAPLGLDAIIIEVADGVLQAETAALLESPVISSYCDGIVFAAADSLGAVAGTEWLLRRNLPLQAVSGAVTASPLAAREISTATGIPVLGKKALADPTQAASILAACS